MRILRRVSSGTVDLSTAPEIGPSVRDLMNSNSGPNLEELGWQRYRILVPDETATAPVVRNLIVGTKSRHELLSRIGRRLVQYQTRHQPRLSKHRYL